MDRDLVNIVGANGWKDIKAGEAWGINNCYPVDLEDFPVTAWFQMHPRELWEGGRNGMKHVDWLKSPHHFPVYMQEKHEDIPASKKYPLSKVKKLWPFSTPVRFSNTFCYMIGLAILLGYKKIHLSGVYLTTNVEVWTEAPGVAIWATIAAMNGIEVTENPQRLLIPFLYGYDNRLPEPYLSEDAAAEVLVDERTYLREIRYGHRYLRDKWYKGEYTGWSEILEGKK